LGRVLLGVGPILALSHAVADAQVTEGDAPVWTYTFGSFDVAVIITILGVALAWREPPRAAPKTMNLLRGAR